MHVAAARWFCHGAGCWPLAEVELKAVREVVWLKQFAVKLWRKAEGGQGGE